MKMASKNETLADIIAEISTMGEYRVIANRLDAAWKRERVEIATYAATQGVNLTNEKFANTPVGNAAAMRDALLNISAYAQSAECHTEDSHVLGYLNQVRLWVKAALSAPARNFDCYKDADSAYIAFCGYDFATKDISDDAFIDWLFAPAEKGGAAQ